MNDWEDWYMAREDSSMWDGREAEAMIYHHIESRTKGARIPVPTFWDHDGLVIILFVFESGFCQVLWK